MNSMWLKSTYFHNIYWYTGTGCDRGLKTPETKLLVATQCLLRLTNPIEGSNLTAENWCSSILLNYELKKNKLTYVGTMKKIYYAYFNRKNIYFVPCPRIKVFKILHGKTVVTNHRGRKTGMLLETRFFIRLV